MSNDQNPAGSREQERGLFRKYRVTRINDPRGKHDGCEFFVLDWHHDKFAVPAIRAYADACEGEFPALAADLRRTADYYEAEQARNCP